MFNIHPELKQFEDIRTFHGYSCITDFFMDLKEVNYQIQEKIRKIVPMRLSASEQQDFNDATSCCICHRLYSRDRKKNGEIDAKWLPCRHHSHISGSYRNTLAITQGLGYITLHLKSPSPCDIAKVLR